MQSLVDVAMKEGAIGFSTGLLYIPGTYASTEEVIELARAAARHGGVYATHIREQGGELHASIEEAVTIGREASMPVQISHFKIKGKSDGGQLATRSSSSSSIAAKASTSSSTPIPMIVQAPDYR